MIDHTLIIEARKYAGGDIHNIEGLVQMYQSMDRERENFETELRKFVAEKRRQKFKAGIRSAAIIAASMTTKAKAR